MKVAYAVLGIFFWIALWGLTELIIKEWEYESKASFYISVLIMVTTIIVVHPKFIDHL